MQGNSVSRLLIQRGGPYLNPINIKNGRGEPRTSSKLERICLPTLSIHYQYSLTLLQHYSQPSHPHTLMSTLTSRLYKLLSKQSISRTPQSNCSCLFQDALRKSSKTFFGVTLWDVISMISYTLISVNQQVDSFIQSLIERCTEI